MLLHHAMVATNTSMILFTGRGGTWLVWVTLAEISTPFLHSGWLLHKLGEDGILFKLNAGMLLLLFAVFRVIGPPLCLNSVVAHRDKWAGFETCLYVEMIVLSAFCLLNWYWFVKLIRIAFGGSDGDGDGSTTSAGAKGGSKKKKKA